MSNADLPNKVSHTILINMPHTIPFTIRAKIFSHLILQQKQEGGMFIHPITISRTNIFEDSFNKIYMQKFDLKNKLKIKFMNELG